ncbi:MAG: ASKHA domain-containing protein [Gammaproteobacteria bacterium]|nr:ASKHA domain-containing protein [Gammaproteobacteria bacterium]MCZ6487940.1 ASKHA domain-containing protein [Gammaproteobacteria bacterium]MCZ6882641.1 ASKHA domain-containing protein [Gammaproteobacteria bacterium]
MSDDEVNVLFMPSGLRGQVPVGTTVLQAAQRLGVDLESICGGQGKCRKCQVLPQEGEFPKHGITSRLEHLSEFTETERHHQAKKRLKDGRRLGCNARLLGDLVVDVPEESQQHKQHITKAVTAYDIQVLPALRLYTVTLPEPDMHAPISDKRRLQKELVTQYELPILDCELSQLRLLQKALAKSERQVTAAVYQHQQIIGVWPGVKKVVYGLAIDLGSTTIAAQLCNLDTGEVVATADTMNPQIRFGEDLMSRVSYVMMNEGGDEAMTRVVREAFNLLAKRAAKSAGIQLEEILDLVVVANPIMHHLFLGIDPTPLGTAPFTLATDQTTVIRAADIDIHLHLEARVCILPCIAGHIGADTAGVILAERPDLSEDYVLLVDIGTNAEIVLGNRNRLLAASSPTGPAFEGAQITSGQRAAPGAMERVRIDPETLEPRFRVIGCEAWSDEDEFAEQNARVGVSGICGSGIIEVVAEMFLAGIIDQDGVIGPVEGKPGDRIVLDGRTWSYIVHEGDKSIRITQNDVRAIQLAKAALHAGIRLLTDRMGISKVDRIGLAGAFGSHIDVKYAMVLGLLPDCDLEHVGSVGNAAGTGARIALLNLPSRMEIGEILPKVEKIETAIEPMFQEYFIEAMALPHKFDPYRELSKVVKLPPPKPKARSSGDDGKRKSRRRRRSRV